MTDILRINDITYRYDPEVDSPPVIDQLTLSLQKGEIGCLLGSSGCGKTTVLRCIAGFHKIEHGEILLNGHQLSAPGVHLSPEKRHVGMVFQDYALFPHLNVCENITFGLQGISSKARRVICEEMLQLVKLNALGHRYPHELSGGQQQRVALARALAPSPQLLLMDEPFSSLDTELRRNLALEVREILKSRGTSAIMVTHDQEEAFAFSDKTGVLNLGRLEQWDIPYNLYHEPQSRFVANFVGQGVFLPGFIRHQGTIETELGFLPAKHPNGLPENSAVEVLIRPDDIVECEQGQYSARVLQKVFAGTSTLYRLKLPTGSILEAALTSHNNYDIGRDIGIRLESDHVIAFPYEPVA